ncbi:metalloprotease 1 precursor [Aphelenchoides avenae]|nr:metalloprotease 1 precursor [Aphelenchus avenae]
MGPSMTDLKVMNALYNCASRCTTPITCYNGGYQNPKNCAACVCPAGIGGNLCELVNPAPIRYGYAPAGVPNTCTGTALQAGFEWAELVGSIGSASFNTQYDSDYAWCHWFINTDATNRIEIEVLEVGDVCVVGCHYGNLEVRVWEGADWGKTGRRMCCAADLWAQGTGTGTLKFVTPAEPGYRAMISLYASYGIQRFRLRYRAIPK